MGETWHANVTRFVEGSALMSSPIAPWVTKTTNRLDTRNSHPTYDVLRCSPFEPNVSPYVKRRICVERGNRPRRSQRDPPGNLLPQEVSNGLPFRNRGIEETRSRARAPAAPGRQGRAVVTTCSSQRRLSLARDAFQCQEHGGSTAPSWAVSGRMRSPDRRIRPVRLQLGRGQGSPTRPAPACHLRAEEPGSPASKRDRGNAQSRLEALAEPVRTRDQSILKTAGRYVQEVGLQRSAA
jgi:hypothetical protein